MTPTCAAAPLGLAHDYRVCTDPQRQDVNAIHAYLARSYWAAGIPLETVMRSLQGSLCFGLFHVPVDAAPAPPDGWPAEAAQVGFARVVTDRATFAYLCDVYVLEAHRGRGLGKRLLHEVMHHPDLAGLRRFMLGTRDAQGLYAQAGFASLSAPQRLMEILRPDIYAGVQRSVAQESLP